MEVGAKGGCSGKIGEGGKELGVRSGAEPSNIPSCPVTLDQPLDLSN